MEYSEFYKIYCDNYGVWVERNSMRFEPELCNLIPDVLLFPRKQFLYYYERKCFALSLLHHVQKNIFDFEKEISKSDLEKLLIEDGQTFPFPPIIDANRFRYHPEFQARLAAEAMYSSCLNRSCIYLPLYCMFQVNCFLATNNDQFLTQEQVRNIHSRLYYWIYNIGKYKFDQSWRTERTVAIAKRIHEDRDWSLSPKLADTLQDAGCNLEPLITRLINENDPKAVRGEWVIRNLLEN